ncbi:phosphopantetheine-binding protein [Paenibacillus daejeonensis]|uniref:phosphopantetheine-binding protein n=1 Tax=Paenibacillus daejeonensis TaxID=135193 RepID=UPI00036A8E5D|nr:phosphopantetheine-binding protein [Paenibacillus daejeonensis]
MKREAYRTQLRGVMTDQLQLNQLPETLEDGHRLHEDLGVDSIMLMQLIVWIELEMKLDIPEHEVNPKAYVTIGALLDFMLTLSPAAVQGEVRQA